jgi:hypothetical protein
MSERDPIVAEITKLCFDIRTAIERDMARLTQTVAHSADGTRTTVRLSVEDAIGGLGDAVLNKVNRALKISSDLRELERSVANIKRRLDAIETHWDERKER